jgi:hypothetical protein
MARDGVASILWSMMPKRATRLAPDIMLRLIEIDHVMSLERIGPNSA